MQRDRLYVILSGACSHCNINCSIFLSHILVLPAFAGTFEHFSPNAQAFAWPDSGLTHYLGLSQAWDLSRLMLTKAWLRPGLLGPTQLSTSLLIVVFLFCMEQILKILIHI
jgi:hypothetical protein